MIETLKDINYFIRSILSQVDSGKTGNNQPGDPSHRTFCAIPSNSIKLTGMIKIVFWYVVSIMVSLAIGGLR